MAAAPCPSDLFLRRAAIAAVGGFEERFTGANQMYEDQGFLAKLYLSSPVYFSSQVWLSYRQHDDSCVAEVTRSGQYHQVRRYFLDWFAGYLAGRPRCSRRVKSALYRARWRYTHPHLYRALDLGQNTARRAGRALRGAPAAREGTEAMTAEAARACPVSVVIPAYNAQATLLQTLQSVEQQSFSDLEAIVVDDGSRDETARIAADFAARDARFRLVRQANAGAARTQPSVGAVAREVDRAARRG